MFKVLNEHLKTVKTAQVFQALNNQANLGNNFAWSGPREKSCAKLRGACQKENVPNCGKSP